LFRADCGDSGLAAGHGICHCLKPETGIWTAIIAGTLIPAFGSSAVQIGRPTGTFIVIAHGIPERYGLVNPLISTACAGVLLFALGGSGWVRWLGMYR